MKRPTFKAVERAVAARLGGVRVPVTGRQRGDAPDILHPRWAIEVKARKNVPLLLKQAMAQARASARGAQTPLVVVHQQGARHDDDLVCLRLADFVALTGEGQGSLSAREAGMNDPCPDCGRPMDGVMFVDGPGLHEARRFCQACYAAEFKHAGNPTAHKLRAFRQAAEISFFDAARLVGTTPIRISRVESGRDEPPGAEEARRWLVAYGYAPEQAEAEAFCG